MKGYEISFSPTGGTQRAAGILAERLLDAIVPVDLTDGREDFSSISLGKGDVAVIAVPSYGGRAPGTAVQRLSVIKGMEQARFWSASMAIGPMRIHWRNCGILRSRLGFM